MESVSLCSCIVDFREGTSRNMSLSTMEDTKYSMKDYCTVGFPHAERSYAYDGGRGPENTVPSGHTGCDARHMRQGGVVEGRGKDWYRYGYGVLILILILIRSVGEVHKPTITARLCNRGAQISARGMKKKKGKT